MKPPGGPPPISPTPLHTTVRDRCEWCWPTSPDRLPWARANDVDLVLAGHNHGGQLRIPFIGPLVAPSRYGVRYASGTFHSPPTVMHVSRGISAKAPFRICCRPELAKLTLHAPSLLRARDRPPRTPAEDGSFDALTLRLV